MGILVTQNTVIPAGSLELQYSNEYDGNRGYQMAAPYGVPGPVQPITLTNNGDVRFVAPLSVYSAIELISVDTANFWLNSKIENHGSMFVSALGGTAYGIRANSWSPALLNFGSITVEGKTQAIAFESWGFHPDNTDPLVDNRGEISARAEGTTITLYLANGGEVVNSGLIYAYSGSDGSGASAISFPNGGGTVINTGQIIAEDADTTTQYATAINFFGMNEVHVVNSGTIRGDYAINEHNNDNSPESQASTVENSGTITGRISLGRGDDVLINSGTIDGLIELGAQNDTYDGRGGHAVQAVKGGDGHDLIWAGRGVETFYGEAGHDIFVAGEGVATFDGGDGYDRVDYGLASSAVTISLEVAGAQSIGGQASTSLLSIEGLFGSLFGDTLTGDTQANLLLGSSGDDRLYGKDGDDYLGGDDGADQLYGGAGDDVLGGGQGADSLTGGAGADEFWFIQGDGRDVVEDFVIGQDKIDLSDDDHGYSEILGLVQDGADVVIQLSANDSIRVKNVQVEALRSSIVLLGVTPRTLVGDAQNNHLVGGVANDTLSGLAGDDELEGRGGDDVLNGGLGHDTLSGGDGIDTVTFADAVEGVTVNLRDGWASSATGRFSATLSGVELIVGSAFQDSLGGNDGANLIRGGEGGDGVWGWAGDDILYGDGGDDIMYGGDGADQLLGGVGNDWLEGGAGDDTLWAGNGTDHLLGGTGNDSYWVADQPTVIVEEAGEGFDTVASYVDYTIGANIEQLILVGTAVRGTGNALANMLVGNSQDNVLYGLEGDDILSGESGADTMVGGQGGDAYWVDNAGDIVTELADQGFDTVASFVSYTLSANVEQLILVGSATTGTGNATGNMLIGNGQSNTLYGLGGDDVLSGEGGADIMIGGAGNDAYWVDSSGDVITELAGEGYDSVAAFANYTLSAHIEQLVLLGAATYGAGNDQANTLTGNALNNVLDGKGGADRLVGGLGDDAYWVDNVGDVVVELAGQGFDTVASYVSYTLADNIEQLKLVGTVALTGTGNATGNILNGNDLNNTLYGLGGDDVLAGEAGADTMIGGIGNDAYWVDNVGDVIVENAGEGFESVASSVSYTLSANLEQLVLLGAAVSGTGNAQSNIIIGNALDNILAGGAGDDLLSGGAGADTFVFGPGTGHDRVSDFGAGGAHDILDLSAYTGSGVTWTITQQGAHTLVAMTNGDSILLDAVLASHVTTQGTSLIWN